MRKQITHVLKDDRDVITQLYSGSWETVAIVASNIKQGTHTYFTDVGGYRADVKVVPATASTKEHLRSTPDGTYRNNLDYLPSV